MTKNITRTIKTTTAYLADVKFIEGEWVAQDLPSIDFIGEVNGEKILKEAKKLYPEANVLVKETETRETTYAMPVDTFMELASVVEPKYEEISE